MREHLEPRILDAEAKGGEQQRVGTEQPHDAVQHRHRREEQPQQVEELPMVFEVEGLGPRQMADALENAILDLPALVSRLANLLQGQLEVGGHDPADDGAVALALRSRHKITATILS